MSDARAHQVDSEQDETFLRLLPRREDASAGVWLFAILSFTLLAAVGFWRHVGIGKSGAELLGGVIGAFLVPLLVVALLSIAPRFRTQRARVRNFGITALVFALLSLSPWLLVPSTYRGSGAPWEHRLAPSGVALRLPSQSWKAVEKKGHLADFASPPGMLVGVTAVKPMKAADFDDVLQQLRSNVYGRTDLTRSKVEEVTTAGGRLVIGTFREKVGRESRPTFVGVAQVFLEGPQKMVTLIFEGHPGMFGDDAQELEMEEMNRIAREIFLSVRE